MTPGYLRAMGTRLRGRDFTWDDGPENEKVVLINKSFAHFLAQFAHWPNDDALGHVLTDGPQDLRIVGVVDDVHEESVEGDAGWQIYYPSAQDGPAGAELVIRTTLPPAALASSVLHTLQSINPNQPVAEFQPIQALVDHTNSPRRFFMLLVTSFAGLGLLLAALGIYGVISYSVAQRTQEIGIRMALGAKRTSVVSMVLRGAMVRTFVGIALGIPAALVVCRLMASQLYGADSYDPVVFGITVLLLALCAVAAALLPARRAASIEPMQALRNE